jgi:formate hydrogenlyase subunit 3/multisubunit Na+/H+ antiporter MnhD subunit
MLALVQRNTKRLLAYSSIAQAGYVMFALGVGLRYDLPGALNAGLFLLVAHAVFKSLAFLSKGACHFYLDATLITQLNGTAQRLPLVAVTFAVALAGLAGIPPLGGFVAKWFIVARSLPARDGLAYAGTALFLANSLLALGYYLPLIARLFTPTAEGKPALRVSPWMGVPLLALSGLAVAMGLAPQPWLDWVRWITHFAGGAGV